MTSLTTTEGVFVLGSRSTHCCALLIALKDYLSQPENGSLLGTL